MPVQSGWVGSSAVTETGQRWMSAARTTLRLNAAGWMSEMVGKSKEYVINVGASDNYDRDALVNAMRTACGGNWSGAAFRINVSGRITCPANRNSVFWFGGDMTTVSYVHIVNNGWIAGRGGYGKRSDERAGDGKHAIENYIGTKLRIENNGIIAGGGGGGGGATNASGGGGGRPLGAGTTNAQRANGAAGTWDAGGAGGRYGTSLAGNGGNFGENGGKASVGSGGVAGAAGNAGYAIYGQAPTYIKAGDIRGRKP